MKLSYLEGDKESILAFGMNGSLLAQMHCYYMRRPSFFQCEACTDAVVMKIGKQEFDALVAESPYFARWVLADATASVTTFTMPAADVELTANYREQGPTTGLNAVTAEQLAIYPNPATSYVRICGDHGTPYTIYSITGKVVAQGTITGETIPVADLSNGLYVVKAGDKASRFVKE